MNRKEFAITILAAAIVASLWVLYGKNFSGNPQSAAAPQERTSASLAVARADGFFIDKTYVVIVTYTDNGFSPSEVTIPKGSAVIFRNYSSESLRVASNPHPAHNGYPTTDGCVGSTFDSCSVIPPRVSWSFNFDIPGTWGYHNHLNPSQSGKVTVE